MLQRRDNPELFDAIANAYEMQSHDKNFNMVLAQSLSDEQLALITKLEIKPTSSSDVKSLKGIEQLSNLESLSVCGQKYTQHAEAFEKLYERKRIIPDYDASKDIEYYKREYDSCQLSDEEFERIYALKKLKNLDVSRQRKITKIDFSKLPALSECKAIDCKELKSVSGLEDTEAVKNGDEFNFDFSGCDRLKTIENLPALVDSIKKFSTGSKQKIFFPSVTYARMYRENRDNNMGMINEMDDEALMNGVFRFTDIDQGNVRTELKPRQMHMATDRCVDIIRTANGDNSKADFSRLANWYRWLTDHIEYDYNALEAGKKNYAGLSQYERDDLHNKSRSSFHTLWSSKGVCVGIRNLFNFGCELMNVEALPANCRGMKKSEVKDVETTVSDHAVSMLSIQKDGKSQHLICDPTWDLGKPESKNFLLTFEEAENNGHQFTMESDHIRETDAKLVGSMQPFLSQQGLLKTQEQGKELGKK